MRYLTEKNIFPIKKILLALVIGFSLSILSLFTWDQQLSAYFKQPALYDLWLKARDITNVGLSEHYFVSAIVIYLFCRFLAPKIPALMASRAQSIARFRAWSRDFFFALLLSGVIVHIFKFTVGRQRPHKSLDFNPYVFEPMTTHWDNHSYISGHSQVMFTVATMLSLAFPRARWVFFTLAALFSFTRVIVHDHFLSDVLGGATIGYVGSLLAVYLIHHQTQKT